MTRRLVAVLGVWVTAFVLIVQAETPPRVSPKDTAKPAADDRDAKLKIEDAANQQERLKRQFDDFTQSLLRLAQRLEASDKQEDKDKATAIRKAIAKAREQSIDSKFSNLVDGLRRDNLVNSIEDLQKVLDQNKEIRDDLRALMEILLKDNRGEELRKEILEKQRLLDEIKRVLDKQLKAHAVNVGNRVDKKNALQTQKKVSDQTAKILDPKAGKASEAKRPEAKPGQGKDGKGGEAKEGESKAGQAKENKGGEGKDGKSGEGKDGEPKDGKGGEGKDNKEGKDGKGGEGKGGEGKDGKGGEGKDGKGGEGKDGKGGEGKDGKGGEGKGGEPKDGKGGKSAEAKGGDSKGGDKPAPKSSSEPGKPGAGKPGDSKPGSGKSDSKAGGASKSDSKSGQGGPAKPGSKSGEGKAGSGSPKAGGQPSQGGGKSGQPGGQPPSGQPSGQPGQSDGQKQDNPVKKQIEDSQKYQKGAEKDIDEGKRADGGAKQEDAAKELEKAIKKLEDLLKQLREEEAERLLAQLQARCQHMLALQIVVRDGTVDLDKGIQVLADKKATRVEQQKSLELSDKEDEIAKEALTALRLIEAEGSAVAFAEVFKQVHADMVTVGARLRRTDTGTVTVTIENDIIATLQEMIEALKKARQDNKDSKPKKGGGGGQPPDQKLIDTIAELKMIRAMQLRVNARTEIYGKQYTGEQAPPPVVAKDPKERETYEVIQKELKDLAGRQEKIGKVTHDIATGKNEAR